MNPEPMLSLGSKILRVFKVIGRVAFVKRLHDFLVHEGRRSRAETLAVTVKVVLDLEKAEAQRIANSESFRQLMKAAGFPDEKIQAALTNPEEKQRVALALSTVLQYVDAGIVTVKLIEERKSVKEEVVQLPGSPVVKQLSVKVRENKTSNKRYRGPKKK